MRRFHLVFLQISDRAPKYDIQRLGSTQRRAGVWAFFFIFFSLSKHGYGLASRRKQVHPVWSLAVVAFNLAAPKSAESLGMAWVGLKSRRRQWRTDSADMVEWDECWAVDFNANAAYLCSLCWWEWMFCRNANSPNGCIRIMNNHTTYLMKPFTYDIFLLLSPFRCEDDVRLQAEIAEANRVV
jgi:hypothetical protein